MGLSLLAFTSLIGATDFTVTIGGGVTALCGFKIRTRNRPGAAVTMAPQSIAQRPRLAYVSAEKHIELRLAELGGGVGGTGEATVGALAEVFFCRARWGCQWY
ncbi:hypothetical protein F5Y03DRAFT_362627, partial [Xylaria venustula]